jgi:hypothetical protein
MAIPVAHAISMMVYTVQTNRFSLASGVFQSRMWAVLAPQSTCTCQSYCSIWNQKA